jgi:hypothetical protein
VDGVEMVRLPSMTTEIRIVGGEFSWAKVGGPPISRTLSG